MTLLIEDRDLLTRFRAGDRAALDHVYRHYIDPVTRFLRAGFVYSSAGQPASFAGFSSPTELEGVVQEVFARAFAPRARLAYDGLRPYIGFLIGISRNVALDDLRRRARRGETLVAPEGIELAAAADDAAPEAREVAESLDRRRARELVASYLSEECDERDRRLYQLRFDEELPQTEAAERAGLTRIQVRRWETGFKARLLRYLKRADFVWES
jgi:RNA polymerase sigma factor (sigma-70 family)